MAPQRPRVVFRTMSGAERLGVRELREEFGDLGEVVCVGLRIDRGRHPESVEVEMKSAKTLPKLQSWKGSSSDLPLYRSEELIYAVKRDNEASFVCYIDGLSSKVDTFTDLEAFATFLTDTCSATIRSTMLLWAPARGTYARVECEQKADLERLISKAAEQTYMSQNISVSTVAGDEYSGIGDGYRVDWSVVVNEAAMLGLEKKDGKKLEKKAKKDDKAKAKKGKKNDKKGKKSKGKKKKADKSKKIKKKKKNKKEKSKKKKKDSSSGSSNSNSSSSSSSSSSAAKGKTSRGKAEVPDNSSEEPSPPRTEAPSLVMVGRRKVPEKRPPPGLPVAAAASSAKRPNARSGPMAVLDEDGDGDSGSDKSSDGSSIESSSASRSAAKRKR